MKKNIYTYKVEYYTKDVNEETLCPCDEFIKTGIDA